MCSTLYYTELISIYSITSFGTHNYSILYIIMTSFVAKIINYYEIRDGLP